MTSSTSNKKILTRDNMNPRIRKAEYAVRGELAIRSEQIKTVSFLFFKFSPSPTLSFSLPLSLGAPPHYGDREMWSQKMIRKKRKESGELVFRFTRAHIQHESSTHTTISERLNLTLSFLPVAFFETIPRPLGTCSRWHISIQEGGCL